MTNNQFDEPTSPVTLADVMLKVLLMVFVMYMVLAVVAKKNDEGNVSKKAEFQITAEWNKARDPAIDCDIDLWVRNPDGQIVYWSSKENDVMNIERDDIGARNDSFVNERGETINTNEDKEYWYLRAVKPGEYTANLHLFSCLNGGIYSSRPADIIKPVSVEVKLTKLNPKSNIIDVKMVSLDTIWGEKTAFNFTINGTGEVTKITQIPTKIINARSAPAMTFP